MSGSRRSSRAYGHNASTTILSLLALFISVRGSTQVAAAKPAVVSIPSSDTYLLPSNFEGNSSLKFVDTTSHNAQIDSLLTKAKAAPFISYDQEFLDLLGPNPTPHLVAEQTDLFAYEGGVWYPNRNEVWFSSSPVPPPTHLTVLSLNTNKLRIPNIHPPILSPNGGYYFDGKMYFTSIGNASIAPGVVEIDPNTYQSSYVVNSYFGAPFNGPDDVTWVRRGQNKYMFFTDPAFAESFGFRPESFLPNAIYRFDPQQQSVAAVLSRADILNPNGISISADQSTLYCTDTSPTFPIGPVPGNGIGGSSSGTLGIYQFTLDGQSKPVEKSLVGLARSGIADGVKIDDSKRVWTAEGEGVVVHNAAGKVIGVFNADFFLESAELPSIANFALAGNKLVILAVNRIWVVELGRTLVNPKRFQ